ncbi:DUF7519 family protein [Haloarchaeobius sp. DFWS5]|uniref:DUF7519 family protein n=1 Tax=Haloarchaeobius sp. DFWS5 TaxID=3446114 RepID=UPI003EBE88D1
MSNATETTPITVTHRPTAVSTAASVLAVVTVSFLLGTATDTTFPVIVGSVGVVITALALWIASHDEFAIGLVVGLIGLPVALAGVALAWAGVGRLTVTLALAPTILGGLLVAAAVIPRSGTGSRLLLKVGAAVVMVGILVAGITKQVSFGELLLAGVVLVFAWDAGENAMNVGEQLGREPKTWPVEAAHLCGTAIVGAVTIGLGQVTKGLGTPGLPLGQFALLLVAVVVLTAALHE